MTSDAENAKYPEFRNWLGGPGAVSEHTPPLDEQKRLTLIDNVVDAIEAFYLDQSAAATIAAKLREKALEGVYNHISSCSELASALTTDLQALSGDKHFRCLHGISHTEPSTEEQLARLQNIDYGFGDVKIIEGNIALMEIILFAPVHWTGVRDRIRQVMQNVSQADALVIDLRKSRGGDPKTVSLLASYLNENEDEGAWDEQKNPWLEMVHPSDNTTEKFPMTPPIEDTGFSTEKPVYILTSPLTISGGEDLAYGLQARKRATVIGEKTAGAANLPRACVLPDGFILWVPHKYPVCPVTGGNWEGVGVRVDVAVSVAEALESAVRLAGEALDM
ncbi:ClpP/crotonase-like domain-containing protein [Aspergillus pseudoustus]|uniref:ClpP/crotonase-like domain-containing protein n=1 Tax=Aspergillus pseudoustus TaxID=1810923 RepID=A0ABR4JGC5_9EURO